MANGQNTQAPYLRTDPSYHVQTRYKIWSDIASNYVFEYWFIFNLGSCLTLTGVIVHGFGVYFFLGDEGMPGGSNWTIECVLWLHYLQLSHSTRIPPNLSSFQAMRSIDHAWARARALGLDFPLEPGTQHWYLNSIFWVGCMFSFLRCWLQGDNCPKEVRNSFIGKWCAMMTQAQYFKCVSHAHLCVGHTHEDIGRECVLRSEDFTTISMHSFSDCWILIVFWWWFIHALCPDGLFSVVTSALRTCTDLQTPSDVMRCLTLNMSFTSPVSNRTWSNNVWLPQVSVNPRCWCTQKHIHMALSTSSTQWILRIWWSNKV